MCWTKNLFVFLSVAVCRRPPAAARPPDAAAPRAQARVPRAKRADAWRGKSTPILQKMKRDCFFACKYISDDTQFTKHKVDKEHKPQYCQQVP